MGLRCQTLNPHREEGTVTYLACEVLGVCQCWDSTYHSSLFSRRKIFSGADRESGTSQSSRFMRNWLKIPRNCRTEWPVISVVTGTPNCQFVQLQNSQIVQGVLRSHSFWDISKSNLLFSYLVTLKEATYPLAQTMRQVSAAGYLGYRVKWKVAEVGTWAGMSVT